MQSIVWLSKAIDFAVKSYSWVKGGQKVFAHGSYGLVQFARGSGGGTFAMDHLRIRVAGGRGGDGLAKYGGRGGDGGDVVLVAQTKASLLRLEEANPSKFYLAATGSESKKSRILGAKGRHLFVPVPLGVTISTDDRIFLGDLNNKGERLVVSCGGKGGCPETNFVGKPSEWQYVHIDLKLMADVGFVGFPNAGKSTLLQTMSRAQPKIGAYPFTTVRPEIGIVHYEDHESISLADLPGLIEGAHRNVGMGHSFLKHVERTRVLLFVVDINGFQLKYSWPYRTAFETIMLLNKEIELFDASLLRKPTILCLNKCDTDPTGEKVAKIIEQVEGIEGYKYTVDEEIRPEFEIRFNKIVPISARSGDSISTLKYELRETIEFFEAQLRTDAEQLYHANRS